MNKKSLYKILFVILIILLLAIEVVNVYFANDSLEYELAYGIAARGVGAAICIIMMAYCSFSHLFSSFGRFRDVLLIIPCCLVAINNFPFISVFSGEAILDTKWYFVILFAVQCFLVGLFEETAFRGCVFMLILEKKHATRKEIFYSIILSSLVFGGIHIVNLFVGAGIVPVVLQLGYSFLIGAMCSVVLLVTKRLWLSIIIHSVFNFAGGLVPTLGSGEIWPMSTVILTVVVSLIVAAYTVVLFFRYDLSKMQEIFTKKEKNK